MSIHCQIVSTSPSSLPPQQVLGHTVHLVCASNGVVPQADDETVADVETATADAFTSLPQHVLLVADTLDIALQVLPGLAPLSQAPLSQDVYMATLRSTVSECVAHW
jgi:hypothetical protein